MLFSYINGRVAGFVLTDDCHQSVYRPVCRRFCFHLAKVFPPLWQSFRLECNLPWINALQADKFSHKGRRNHAFIASTNKPEGTELSPSPLFERLSGLMSVLFKGPWWKTQSYPEQTRVGIRIRGLALTLAWSTGSSWFCLDLKWKRHGYS